MISCLLSCLPLRLDIYEVRPITSNQFEFLGSISVGETNLQIKSWFLLIGNYFDLMLVILKEPLCMTLESFIVHRLKMNNSVLNRSYDGNEDG